MAEVTYGLATAADLPQIQALQEKNLKQYHSVETQAAQGFLTFRYSLALLQQMNSALPHVLAFAGPELVGYALSTTTEICSQEPLLRPLVQRLDGLAWAGKRFSERRFYVMGQICVAESFRGQGVFDGLYATHKRLNARAFDCLVTEISLQNTRSLAAHRRVGFVPVGESTDAHDRWAIVAWDWQGA